LEGVGMPQDMGDINALQATRVTSLGKHNSPSVVSARCISDPLLFGVARDS